MLRRHSDIFSIALPGKKRKHKMRNLLSNSIQDHDEDFEFQPFWLIIGCCYEDYCRIFYILYA